MVGKIVLLGYMGVGKSTIGKELSKKIHRKFIDLDDYIVANENLSVNQLFEQKGEIYFRKMEHHYFKELIENGEDFILSIGGGTPCYYNNHFLLENKNVHSIYLKASIETLYTRLVNEKKERPLLKDLNETQLKEYIGKHLFERSFYYQKAKNTITVDAKSATVIGNEIEDLILNF